MAPFPIQADQSPSKATIGKRVILATSSPTARCCWTRARDPDDVLSDDAADSGKRDLERDGSYLVFRQLSQDGPGLSGDGVDSVVAPNSGPSNDHSDRQARRVELASTSSGADWAARRASPPARPRRPEACHRRRLSYFAQDADGTRYPTGAHVQRSHPRDSLDPSHAGRAAGTDP